MQNLATSVVERSGNPMAPVESLDYISQLKTPLDCETVMKNAKVKGRTDVYDLAFRRKCQLAGLANEDPNDPLIKAFYETSLLARSFFVRSTTASTSKLTTPAA